MAIHFILFPFMKIGKHLRLEAFQSATGHSAVPAFQSLTASILGLGLLSLTRNSS